MNGCHSYYKIFSTMFSFVFNITNNRTLKLFHAFSNDNCFFYKINFIFDSCNFECG